MLYLGDCLEVLKTLKDNSVDALVTDPPAGISFMSMGWDKNVSMLPAYRECLRVMKPGAHGLVWAIPRTSHWTASACEDAGFEIRDVVTHIFGSGFPKSLNISIAIDKQSGGMGDRGRALVTAGKGDRADLQNNKGNWTEPNEHQPITEEAKKWQGWGTALKPASEHWILVRKPIEEDTVAANVLKHGTGGINIDASRISISKDDPNHRPGTTQKNDNPNLNSVFGVGNMKRGSLGDGRFPANLVLSHNLDCENTCTPGCAVAALDEQSGFLIPAGNKNNISRFFYCAKASKKDRNAGCEVNRHPTVKSTTLMSYLINLVTPPNGIVLDPFMGSGSTGVAAIRNGFQFIGIEKEKEYFDIARKRIEHEQHKDQPSAQAEAVPQGD